MTTGDFVAWATEVNGSYIVRTGIVIVVGNDGIFAAIATDESRKVEFIVIAVLRATIQEAGLDASRLTPVPDKPVPGPAPNAARCRHVERESDETGWRCVACGWVEVYA